MGSGEHQNSEMELDTNQVDSIGIEHEKAIEEPSDIVAYEATGEDLPDGYYWSFNFIGTCTALCLSSVALYMYLLMPSAILAVINNDLGPSKSIAWWSIARTAAQSVTFTLVGRLSDIFGRRWFFIGGNLVALIGTVITAASMSVPQLIIGAAITGIGEAVQNSYNIALPELVKNKHRPIVISAVFASSAPFAAFGSIISTTMVKQGISWRWCFYLPLICIGIAVILLFFCYHPPVYSQLHSNSAEKTKMRQLRELDWVGIVLFIASLVMILLPLGWGGSLFPWKSAATISTLLVGAVLLAVFVFWEARQRGRNPLVPIQLITNRGFMALVACATVGSCCYFPTIFLWPQQIAHIYGITGTYAGWLSCTVGAATALGSMSTGFVIRAFGNSRWVILVASVGMCGFVAGLAALTPDNLNLGIAFTILGPFCVGIIEVSAMALAPLFCLPEDLGLASGLLGTIRSAGASVATAIFSSVLSTRLAVTIPTAITPAAEQAGFDMSKIATLAGAARAGTLDKVPGITHAVIDAVTAALPNAYAAAFKTVYLASLAFGGVAIVGALLTKNAAPYLTDQVSRKLQPKGLRK
ncbi:fungal trichothecene efflux pump [Coniochaeta sp. 2T2.1]|nr:fungal trichothecene efflux pump [Coniochaeta sp. 2T2.1]